ncbi:MAG: DsrE family protein [Rhodocyclaceae bacterium]|nr:DsrE family protein [Rhodocyclaceae bacterium]
MNTLQRTLALLLIAGTVGLTGCASAPEQKQTKTIYHLNLGLEQASNGLRNIRNHLAADPGAKITVVTHALGVDFLLDGAKDKNGNPYNVIVEDLVGKGVDFRVCNFTLTSRKIDSKLVIAEAKIVPSGVAEIGKLQTYEGYAYLKP